MLVLIEDFTATARDPLVPATSFSKPLSSGFPLDDLGCLGRKTPGIQKPGCAKGAGLLRLTLLSTVLMAVFGAPQLSHAQIQGNVLAVYNDFTTALDTSPAAITLYGAVTTSFVTDGLMTSFSPLLPGKFSIVSLNNVNKVDFTHAGSVLLTLRNPSAVPEPMSIQLYDEDNNMFGGDVVVPAETTQTVALVFEQLQTGGDFGMIGLPSPYDGMVNVQGRYHGNLEWGNIRAIQLYAYGPLAQAEQMSVGHIETLAKFTIQELLTGLSDPLGQSTITHFENQASSASVLPGRLATELAAINSEPPGLLSVDSYGGSTALPGQQATGRFRLAQVNGKWWMVDPIGNLFFSSGVDGIDTIYTPTITTNREYMFQWLPALSDPLSAYYGSTIDNKGAVVTTYNFYAANLERKFQTSNWEAGFESLALARLKNWGFNTLGSYSERHFLDTNTAPYLGHISLGVAASFPTGNDVFGPMYDPYDPSFAAMIHDKVFQLVTTLNSDPMCMGVFAGIELPWNGLQTDSDLGIAFAVLDQPSTLAAKANFLKTLEKRYGLITKLNLAWGTRFASWDQFGLAWVMPDALTPGAKRDMAQFVVFFSQKFFRIIHDELKAQDPGMPFYGTEFSSTHFSPEAVQGASGYVDALCVNHYGITLPQAVVDACTQYNIPLLFTEWCIPCATSGLFQTQGLSYQPDEAARSAVVTAIFNDALTSSICVGANYFEYIDNPVTGEYQQGGNANMGMVDITDSPYVPLVNTFKQLHSNMYSARYGG